MEELKIKKHKTLIWIFLALLLILRFSFSALLWNKAGGFFMLTGDDAGKAMTAYNCAVDLDFWGLSKSELPPVHPWLVGVVYRIYPDLLFVSSLVNTLFALGTILILFLLTQKLFPSNDLPVLLSVGFITFYPWFVWASLMAQRDGVLRFFVLLGLLFWVSYIADKKRFYLFLFATSFLLSTATMYEGWFFTFVFILFVVKEIVSSYRNFKSIDFYLIGSIVLCSLYMLWRLYWDYQRYGTPLGYLIRERIEYTSAWPSETRGFFERLFAYPVHLTKMAPWVFPIAIIMIFLPKKLGKVGYNYLIFVFLSFIIFIGSALFQTGYFIHSAQVPLVLYLLTFLPIASFGLVYLLLSKYKKKLQYIFVSVLIFLFSWRNITTSFYPPKSDMRSGAIKTGMLLKSLWRNGDISSKDKVILEERVDVKDNRISVESYMLRIFEPTHIIADRQWKWLQAKDGSWSCTSQNNPSTFDLPLDALEKYLRANNFRIAIIFTDRVAKKLDKIMTCALQIDDYKFYFFREDKKLSELSRLKAKEIPEPWLGR